MTEQNKIKNNPVKYLIYILIGMCGVILFFALYMIAAISGRIFFSTFNLARPGMIDRRFMPPGRNIKGRGMPFRRFHKPNASSGSSSNSSQSSSSQSSASSKSSSSTSSKTSSSTSSK